MISGNMHRANGLGHLALGDEAHMLVLADFHEVAEASPLQGPIRAERPFGEEPVGGDDRALAVNHNGCDAGGGEALADRSFDASNGDHQRIRQRRFGEAPQQKIILRADPIDLDRAGSGTCLDAGYATGPIAPSHGLGQLQAIPGLCAGSDF